MTGPLLRFTNTLILASILALTLTGLYGLMWPMPAWMFETHRICSWALVALIPWKTLIALRSLRRGFDRRLDRSVIVGVSILLATLVLAVLTFGVMWTWRIGPDVLWLGAYGDAVISWHWMLALGLLIPFAIHVWRRWPRPKPADFAGRRNALKLIGLAAVGAIGWSIAEAVARQRQAPDAARRHTGSREEGSFTGLAFPVTHTIGQGQIVPDLDTWRLTINGAVDQPLQLTYADVLALPAAEVTATLDCTSGWYTTQVWSGVRLAHLLTVAGVKKNALAVILRDVSGYAAYFTLAEAEEILLATHSGGQVFDHWHGFPLRAVVPSRRGWQWVKWLTAIEVAA
jgi:hypothetical protein